MARLIALGEGFPELVPPEVPRQIDGDSIIYKHYVNMGIAVASDAGLVVPNVKDADRKGMLDVSREIAAVVDVARGLGVPITARTPYLPMMSA